MTVPKEQAPGNTFHACPSNSLEAHHEEGKVGWNSRVYL